MKKIILFLSFVALLWSCNKHGGVDPMPLNASLTLNKTTVVYNGITFDSVVIVSWSAMGATTAILNGESVPTAGTKIFTVLNTTTFNLVVSDGKNSVKKSETVTVSVDPTLNLLCSGWLQMTREETRDNAGQWHDLSLSGPSIDDKKRYTFNRKELYDFGTNLEGNQHRYGYSTDTVFALYPQENLLHIPQPAGSIDWSIKSLTQSGLVIEGYIPGLFGSPPLYMRQTFTFSN